MTLAVAKACGPGRPKDLEKRAAILAAAKRLFPMSGFEGTSMDAIAAEAGVSKLTVYSHFTDKETLFVAAIRARCRRVRPSPGLRQGLLEEGVVFRGASHPVRCDRTACRPLFDSRDAPRAPIGVACTLLASACRSRPCAAARQNVEKPRLTLRDTTLDNGGV